MGALRSSRRAPTVAIDSNYANDHQDADDTDNAGLCDGDAAAAVTDSGGDDSAILVWSAMAITVMSMARPQQTNQPGCTCRR